MNPAPLPVPSPWDGLNLETLLPLTDVGGDCHASTRSEDNVNGRIYGGQLLGQALWAAAQTVSDDRRAHMLQASFYRGAALDQPLGYQVQRLLDGSRYSSRHVRVRQGENFVLDAQASFQVGIDSAHHHQQDADPVPEPETLPNIVDVLRAAAGTSGVGCLPLIGKQYVEMRAVDADSFLFEPNRHPRVRYWIRLRRPLPDSPVLHDAALAFLSDYFVTLCCYSHFVPLLKMRSYYVASLNQGLWFHERGRMDDWLLFDTHSPVSGHGRGFANVRIYDRQRRLLATATQQCTMSERR